ncbi:hypothetical protein WOLCODRAFT_161110 [Wolfiporia cocos MD-104 SS10]|uniref:SAC domain-containing protein n=1 Tax=Wolfiporia cocos (strain MD-104) TaxID=742152 RepID=A0A2H3JPC2_WOLCO|nr:hypothetical protein WOLCODRAFT_161110 [Wolfiporia cocos MD-104 SS10]
MKRLLSFKQVASAAKAVNVPAAPVNPTSTVVTHTTSLQPKYVLPPLPHPCPHEHIAIIATSQGLLLRPHFRSENHAESYVRVTWGKTGSVEELPYSAELDSIDWSESVVVYGIVGILNLFSASYLLVVSSRSEVGHLFEPRHAVYGVKGVTAIPLTEDRARSALAVLMRRNSIDSRLSSQPLSRPDTPSLTEDEEAEQAAPAESNAAEGPASPHVKFAEETQVKVMTPQTAHGFENQEEGSPPSPSSSVTSTPSSEYSLNTDVVKTLTARLSFWSILAKRPATSSNEAVPRPSEDSQSSAAAPQSRVSLDTTSSNAKEQPEQLIESLLSKTASSPPTTEEKHSELEDKVLRECIREFTRGGMYFAYAFDITRSLQHKHELIAKAKVQNALLADLNAPDRDTQLSPIGDKVDVLAEPAPTLPLWRRVDRQYWWNEWLSRPFIDAGLHSYVLPIMQGFYQVAQFNVPREPVASEQGDHAVVDYILVSRRSRNRAGLRYQRRGVDEDANVANFVETETIMRVEREGFSNVFSHVQIRGSIPLYWKQEGYSLKPPPQLASDRTHEQNLDAIRRHFKKTIPYYGPHTIVNLAEQHGKEAQITDAYRDYVSELNDENIRYLAYDFHTETKGMKYENISKLISQVERTFENQGYFWISHETIMSQQKGVFRVNCIDCLDRTNVVESAFARHVLDRQLGAVALLDPAEDKQRTEADVVFNDVWANNGDAISREYAGTSALKGDFTRTGKRDLAGMLNDGVNSLARMYSSTFADWFSQAVIDYVLGNRTISVFSEFLNKLQSTDPRDLIRLSKIRADAIATCVSRVLPEGERLLSGWTLFSPTELNVKVGDKFEEKVLLLSSKAIYIISYDYTLEKVKMYTRVPLCDIVQITKGAYILSPLEEASRDPLQNAGFVVTWRNVGQDTRVTSYSIRNNPTNLTSPPTFPVPRSPLQQRRASLPAFARKNMPLSGILSKAAAPAAESDKTYVAFKVLPIDPTRTRRDTGSFIEPADELAGAANCKEAVDLIVDTIRQAYRDAGGAQGDFLHEEEIVSLAEAQRMTSVYAKMEYGVKRLLWLGG